MYLLHELSHDKFREIIKTQTLALRSLGHEWKEELLNSTKLPEDVIGEINVATGQSELLIHERFTQFSNLIDDSEFKRSEKEITLEDLQGFWDIIFFQVENIKRKFERLAELKKNDWMPLSTSLPPHPQVQKPKPFASHNKKVLVKSKHVGVAARSSIRDHILAQRRKLQLQAGKGGKGKETGSTKKPEVELRIGQENTPPNRSLRPQTEETMDIKTFQAGFFEIHTPVRNANESCKRIRPDPDSSPVLSPPKVLASSALKKRVQHTPVFHKDYSPCMRITRSMKRNRQLQLLSGCSP